MDKRSFKNKKEAISCDDCPKGRHQKQKAQTSCQICPKGTYQNQNKQSKCISCDKGMFSNTEETKTNAFQECVAGTYALQPASTFCAECQIGEKQGASKSVVCVKCGFGSFSKDKATATWCFAFRRRQI